MVALCIHYGLLTPLTSGTGRDHRLRAAAAPRCGSTGERRARGIVARPFARSSALVRSRTASPSRRGHRALVELRGQPAERRHDLRPPQRHVCRPRRSDVDDVHGRRRLRLLPQARPPRSRPSAAGEVEATAAHGGPAQQQVGCWPGAGRGSSRRGSGARRSVAVPGQAHGRPVAVRWRRRACRAVAPGGVPGDRPALGVVARKLSVTIFGTSMLSQLSALTVPATLRSRCPHPAAAWCAARPG